MTDHEKQIIVWAIGVLHDAREDVEAADLADATKNICDVQVALAEMMTGIDQNMVAF